MSKSRFFYFIYILYPLMFFSSAKSDSKFDIGKDIFLNKAVCSSCHVLADAQSNGQIGPNLNVIKPDITRVIMAVTNGVGVMPSYQDQLSAKEIEAVSFYVSESVN